MTLISLSELCSASNKSLKNHVTHFGIPFGLFSHDLKHRVLPALPQKRQMLPLTFFDRKPAKKTTRRRH